MTKRNLQKHNKSNFALPIHLFHQKNYAKNSVLLFTRTVYSDMPGTTINVWVKFHWPLSLCNYFYRPRSLAKQGDNALGSVRPSVCPSVCPSVRPSVRPLTAEPFDLRPWILVCRKKSHYQSEVFVCVSTISRGCGRSAFNIYLHGAGWQNLVKIHVLWNMIYLKCSCFARKIIWYR